MKPTSVPSCPITNPFVTVAFSASNNPVATELNVAPNDCQYVEYEPPSIGLVAVPIGAFTTFGVCVTFAM